MIAIVLVAQLIALALLLIALRVQRLPHARDVLLAVAMLKQKIIAQRNAPNTTYAAVASALFVQTLPPIVQQSKNIVAQPYAPQERM